MNIPADDAASLAREASLLTRYLLDRECPPEMVERYARAQREGRRKVDGGPRSERVASFAFAHPWSIPYLDAAGALVRDGAQLRDKLLLMSAILEASPRFASEFLPRSVGRTRTLVRLLFYGLIAVSKTVIGLPLILVARTAG